MTFVIFLTAALLDPIRLILTLAVVLVSKCAWIVPAAAAISAIAIETMLTMTQITRVWGDGIIIGFLASLIHAGAIYGIRMLIINHRARKSP